MVYLVSPLYDNLMHQIFGDRRHVLSEASPLQLRCFIINYQKYKDRLASSVLDCIFFTFIVSLKT